MRRTSIRQERVKLQGPTAGGRFRAAEHDADFLANLVDENDAGFALGNGAGQFAHGLAHQPGLQADMRIAHFTIEFLLRHQGRHRVDDDNIDGVALDQHLGDVHRFFAAAGLADEQRFQVDAQLFGPSGIERMLGIDEGGDATGTLRPGNRVQCQRGFAARFGTEDLDDAAFGQSDAAQSQIERQAARRNALHFGRGPFGRPQRHNRAFAELLFDLGDRGFQMRMVGQRVLHRLARFTLRLLFRQRFFLGHTIVHFDGGDHVICVLLSRRNPESATSPPAILPGQPDDSRI